MRLLSSIFVEDYFMHSSHQRSKRGQGLVEYALILVLVAVVVIVVLSLTGRRVGDVFCSVFYSLGSELPAGSSACPNPYVVIQGISSGQTVSGLLVVEAIVKDDRGTQGLQVTFYVHNQTITESISRYCLGRGDSVCDPFDFSSLPAGEHTLRVEARDAQGNVGSTSITFFIS
jgi:pilus assembly protein Flp/PilA